MQIIIASNNKKKALELTNILGATNISIITQDQLAIPSVAETGLTFVENALLKARHACQQGNLPAIADDSGLEVDALDRQPGIYSARYAGAATTTDEDNVAKLLKELRDTPESKRTARYQCVIVFLRSAADPTPIICQGTWEGSITLEPQGKNGFGYDPVFWVPDHNCTAAQLPPTLKNQISHRAQALKKLVTALKQELSL